MNALVHMDNVVEICLVNVFLKFAYFITFLNCLASFTKTSDKNFAYLIMHYMEEGGYIDFFFKNSY